MKLFVDDIRKAPSGYVVARTVAEAKTYLLRDDIDIVSLDHDMGACAECLKSGASVGDMLTPETTFLNWCPHAEDGTALARWMVENQRLPPVMYVHSMNPCGRDRMNAILGLAR